MTIIIATHTKDGILIASDSRSTAFKKIGNELMQIDGYDNDNTKKIFSLKNKDIVIAHAGQQNFFKQNIEGLVEYLDGTIKQSDKIVDIAKIILDLMQSTEFIIPTQFFLAGYEDEKPFLYLVDNKGIHLISKERPIPIGSGSEYFPLAYPYDHGFGEDYLFRTSLIVRQIVERLILMDTNCGGPVVVYSITPNQIKLLEHRRPNVI